METIVKREHTKAHDLINRFLERHRERHAGLYEGDLYKCLNADFVSEHTKTKTRDALIAILAEEQQGRCCYCMRKINGLLPGDRSIEHVIVNHPTDDNDYNQYLGHGTSLDTSAITSSSSFIEKQTPPPPYPHSVAYENMLLSCMGHCHVGLGTSSTCNNYRGHKFVKPLPLMPNINNEIKYRKDGFIYWTRENDDTNPAVEILGLNNEVLKLIRRIWYKLSSTGQNAATCNRQQIVYEILGEVLDEGETNVSAFLQLLFLFANNSWYWDLLQQFDYFNDSSKFE